MVCPQCQTPNPPTAVRCEHCATPIDLNTPTLTGSPEDDSDAGNLTVENWSAAVTAPSSSDAPGASKQLQSGSVLANRYEILEQLGVGGMGTVYKARDREVDRLVAVKVIRAELANDSEILSRFKQELILARKVTHKNVIRIFDLGRASGIRFITMEYIEGQDLRSLVKKQGRLTPEQSVTLIQQVCLALDAAHGEGIVHRDLKPQNIMVDAQNRIFVMDFGIARTVGAEGLTMTGALVGTPEYMSPEQVKGDDVDGRSDIFSLGIIFYELLTGKMPYRGETVQRAMYKRTIERPTPASSEDLSVPPFLSDVVSKCLEIEPAKRYQSANALSADLDSWKTGVADQATSVMQRWLRRAMANRLVLASAAILILLLAGIFVYRRFPPPGTHETAGPPPIALAVFPFRNASGDPKLDWLGSSLGGMLTNDIGQSARLRTISGGRISEVIHDLKIKPDTDLDSATIDRLAQFSNADVVVYGQYAKFGDQWRIDGTLYDRKNSRQTPLKAEAASEKDILKTVDELAKQVRQNLALSASAVQELQTAAFKPSSSSLDALREYDQGLQAQRVGKKLDALSSFNASLAADSSFALAYSHLGQTYASMGQDDQAQASSLKAVQLSESLPQQERYIIRANHEKILKQYPKAIEAYQTLAKVSPGDTDIQLELAGLYESVGDLDKARASLEKIQALDPKRTEALLARGRVELKSNNPEKGLEFLATALNLAGQVGNEEQKADILQAMGLGYQDLHRPDEALHSFQDSLDIKQRLGLKSGAAASLNAMANTLNAQGKSAEALKDYEQALKLSREVGDRAGTGNVLIDLGDFYVDHGHPDQALALYKESLQIQIDLGNEGTRALLLNNIGNNYLSRGDFQDARTYFEQALQLREKFNVPQDLADTLHNLAETNTNLGLYDQAVDQYHRALDLQRKAANKQMIAIETYSLGTVFSYQGRYGAALSSKEEALKIYRELAERSFWMTEILSGYGNALAQVGKKAEAQAILQEALTLARELKNSDQIASILGLLGDNAFYGGDLTTAKQFFAQASQSSVHSTDRSLVMTTKFNLAKLSIEQGHAQEAIAVLTSLKDQASKTGPKFLALQSSVWLAKAYLQTKNYAKVQEILRPTILQTEKLGLISLTAQSHGLLSKLFRQQGNAAEAAREASAASQLFQQMQAEAHFDPQSRHDFATLLS
jgi:tetratricopeptide (TPR) repeat protein/predicted Ser/Thr protein kinase